jgi:hypothetical protein
VNLPQTDPQENKLREIPLVQMTPKFRNPVYLLVEPADLNHQVNYVDERKTKVVLYQNHIMHLKCILIGTVISNVDREHIVRIS